MTLGFAKARHMLSRAEFGAPLERIHAFAERSADEAVDVLLNETRTTPVTPPLPWVDEPPPGQLAMKLFIRRLEMTIQARNKELKTWWIREMVETPSPFTERMTVFWHNHFTSSLRKVRWAGLLWAQHTTLRALALTNVRALMKAMLRDPAMLFYLDNHQNRRDAPNENLARELLELFSLGEGHYREADIKEAARALTGRRINRETGRYWFDKRAHDEGVKTVLGETGQWGGDELVEVILKQPQCARFIVTKIWRDWLAIPPEPEAIEDLAKLLRDRDYAIKPVLRALLTSNYFLRPAEHGQMIKSPVALVVGTLRMLGITLEAPEKYKDLAEFCHHVGQDLFDPPNVKGWPGGHDWLTSTTLLIRMQGMEFVATNEKMHTALTTWGIGPVISRGKSNIPPGTAGKVAQALLLARPPLQPMPGVEDPAALFEAIILDPVYQLT